MVVTARARLVLAAVAYVLLGGIAAAQPSSAPRAEQGRREVRAVEATTPVKVDGALDDEVWQRAEVVSGFVQSEPREGQPASEPTNVRVAYDAGHLYIAADCHDSGGATVNNIRKDFGVEDQDTFEVILDTFTDRRNGYLFMTNPEGARSDQQVAGEGRERNASWDAVWFVRTSRSANGWTVEMAIPFTSLRFPPGAPAAWGINFSRRIRRKNEIDFWAPVPRAYELTRLSLAGDLVGLPALNPGRDLRVKPFVLGSSVRPTGGAAFDRTADVGVDVKYGLTSATTLDVTLRPDFAQAEADEQQVNLTQFSQFYPEKRDFFLENSGVFYVGDAARNQRVHLSATPDTDLLMFFSRRIGLTPAGLPIPIVAGARTTGQVGGLAAGALNVQTRESGTAPANNYSVVRVRKNIFANSDVGAIVMNRQATSRAGDFNRVYGADAYVRLFRRLDWSAYVVKSSTPGVRHNQVAARTSLNWESNFFHGKGGFMTIGDGFRNDMGYYRRVGARKWFLDTGVRPRVRWWQQHGVRELHPHVVWNYYTDQRGRVTGKNFHNGFTFFFNNGGYSQVSYNARGELIDAPLRLSPRAAALPGGSYAWHEYQYQIQTDQSRLLSGNITVTHGGLWGGAQRSVSAGVNLRPGYRFWMTADIRRTASTYDTHRFDFVAQLWTARLNYSFSSNMFVDALLQYNQDLEQLNTNVRFNFIHRPLSDLFVVFNEQRFTTAEAAVPGRGVIVKFTRMLAF